VGRRKERFTATKNMYSKPYSTDMYTDTKNTIHSPNSSWKGLSRNSLNLCPSGRRATSSSVVIISSPLSFLIFAARRESKVGAYVSGTVNTSSTYAAPARISCSQYNQRQPWLMLRYLLTKGPMTGPRKGAAEKAAIGTPRSSARHRSANVPPTSVIGALKAMPSMARATRRVVMFLEAAAGMMKMSATRSVLP